MKQSQWDWEYQVQHEHKVWYDCLRRLKYFLGLEFAKTMKDLVIHQGKYLIDILNRINMLKWNSTCTSMEENPKLSIDENEMAFDTTLYKKKNRGMTPQFHSSFMS